MIYSGEYYVVEVVNFSKEDMSGAGVGRIKVVVEMRPEIILKIDLTVE